QGGGVDEGLGGRAGWPPRQYVVELADAVIAPADKGFQLPGVRVQGDQRDLRLVGLRRRRALRPLLLGELAIDLRHPCADRVRGGALQVKIEGGINPEAVGNQIALRELREQLVFHHVDEKRRL